MAQRRLVGFEAYQVMGLKVVDNQAPGTSVTGSWPGTATTKMRVQYWLLKVVSPAAPRDQLKALVLPLIRFLDVWRRHDNASIVLAR